MSGRGGARENSGRPKGKPNVDKREMVAMLAEKYPDYHPILALAELAHTTTIIDKDGVKTSEPDTNMQFQCHKEIAKYITPQLKAIEITGKDGEKLIPTLSDIELLARINKLATNRE